MTLKQRLKALFDVITQQAEQDPLFAENLSRAIGLSLKEGDNTNRHDQASSKGRPARRAVSVLDPVGLAAEGEEILRDRLTALSLEQLRDILSEYRMDPGKLVMKWKTKDRVISHIVQAALSRAKKGDAFR